MLGAGQTWAGSGASEKVGRFRGVGLFFRQEKVGHQNLSGVSGVAGRLSGPQQNPQHDRF